MPEYRQLLAARTGIVVGRSSEIKNPPGNRTLLEREAAL
jgi:hypothetical protein